MFQFQKVRLKVHLLLRPTKTEEVSIPKGSIKSAIDVLNTIVSNLVSIPKGSIKSWVASEKRLAFLKFQFQKVRLKVGLVGGDEPAKPVSIPKGSIKRGVGGKTPVILYGFNSKRFD